MSDQPGGKPAGWKKDPTGRHFGRYWDGTEWTDHVISAEKVQSLDPLPPRPEPSIFADGPPPVAPVDPPPVAPVERPASGKRPKDGGLKVWKVALGVALGLFLFLGVCVAIIGAGADKAAKDLATQSTDTTPGGPAGTAPAPKNAYNVGDTAKTGDFEVTVYGFKDSQPTSQFDKPKTGNRYVSADVQIANKGSKALTFSSIIGLHLVDAANRQYDVALTTVTPRAPDGQIAAGEALRGLAVFEVPDGTTGLRLRVQGGPTASGAFFTLA